MVEELLLKAFINGGIGVGGGILAAYVYIRMKFHELQSKMDAMEKEREKTNEEIKDISKKIDTVLEYMSALRAIEKLLSAGITKIPLG